jgi:hypothetical protein
MKRSLVIASLLGHWAGPAFADKQADLVFQVQERHSYTQSIVLRDLMTLQLGGKCWDTALDHKNVLQSRIAAAAGRVAKYGSALTGGDDWRKIETQSNSTKDKNRALVADRVAQLKGKVHITVKVEGDDCDGPQPLWMKYLGEVSESLEEFPPKSGKAFITINVLAKAKGVKTEVSADGTKFTIIGARDIEESGWPSQIEMPFKRVSTKN